MNRWERWLLCLLLLLCTASVTVLVRRYWLQSTLLAPKSGGTYIEGSVGALRPLNPWFIVENDVNHDIVSLIFAGLLRYNPQTRKIEEDVATMQVKESRIYTVRLKDDLFWHDSTEESPHPVTADDVVFTFTAIQDPSFPNDLLRQNFRGVRVEKVDNRTVRFTLEEPYSFFPSNLTLGLLPKRSFDGIPLSKLDQATDFGFAPVGAGPYKLKTIIRSDLSTEVTLERFARSLPPVFRLDRIVLRVFPDYSSLLSDLRNLQGIRVVPRNKDGEPIVPSRFSALQYSLPQYVALFFNLDRPVLEDQKLRVGLQLGTDKRAIAEAIHESVLVDTPLLELDTSDWRFKFDPDAAQGALLASKWNLPERVRLQRILEQDEANKAGLLHPDPIVQLREGGVLTLSGSYGIIPRDARVNGISLQPVTGSGSWRVDLPHLVGTGAIVAGTNLIKITAGKNRIVDSFYLEGAADGAQAERLRQERALARLYVETKTLPENDPHTLRITDVIVDQGILRRRVRNDPQSIRINERGEQLELRLLTSDLPPSYRMVADEVAKQWSALGVRVTVDAASGEEFAERLLRRDYDVLLFGQSLLDNLDSFPYWHSSGVQKLTSGEKDLRRDAYNLSQYVSFTADALLTTIRRTDDEKERMEALAQLRTVLKEDVPAIFLYSPVYIFAHHRDILGIELGNLSLHSDRFLTLYKWYVKQERIFRPGKGWSGFFPWLLRSAF